jgi:hypothetical protein
LSSETAPERRKHRQPHTQSIVDGRSLNNGS